MRPARIAAVMTTLALGACHQQTPHADLDGIATFNNSWAQATRTMDNSATLALWDEAGISLLPSTKPIIGKPAIDRFMTDVTRQLAGAAMESFALRCFDIVATDTIASEWCLEHQVVKLPNNQPKFDGWGKMLVVLRRGSDGKWRLLREMWNPALPDSALAASPGVTNPRDDH